jgi:hypothetical protein
MAFEDPELTEDEKQAIMIGVLYPVIPNNIESTIAQARKFLNCGELDSQDDEIPMRLYSFTKDASLIFSAFRQTHGIDLETEQMHWWKFIALFMDLGVDTAFCNLINLRKRLKTGRASKEEIEMAQEISDVVDIPESDPRTLKEREREDEFMRLVRIGQQHGRI